MDQCKECQFRGDIEKCEAASCSKHDSWYAKQLQERIVFWRNKAESGCQEPISGWAAEDAQFAKA